ncbi:hypothetical protein ACE01N_06830 [Saccharicrinis sp. FJH2]|uniref:hypothetical protein n=1 Tax=Saccharicrinis sp. FJH65 TaxID=3344659 RepID=UPI0035F2F288
MSKQTKILLLICSVLLSTAIYAQEWAPVGATWHYSEDYFDSFPLLEGFIKFEVEKDTVFMGIMCKKITKYHKIHCNDRPDIEYMFERNDSIFFWDPNFNEFQLLYDFSATQNDSWQFKVLHDSGDDVDTVRIHVDSIKTLTINDNVLKELHVTYKRISYNGEDESYPYQSKIIERLGDIHYMFNYIPFGAEACDANMSKGLRCYSDGVIGAYETGIADSCEATIVWKDNKIMSPSLKICRMLSSIHQKEY